MNKVLLTSIIDDAVEKLKADLKIVIDKDDNFDFRLSNNLVSGTTETRLEVRDNNGMVVWSMCIDNRKIDIKEEAVTMP